MKNLKKVFALLLAMMTLLTAAGCAPKETTEKTQTPVTNNNTPTQSNPTTAEPVSNEPIEYNRAADFEPPTLDPHNTSDSDSIRILLLMTEGLVRYRDGQIVPGIAESWEVSEDGYEYTFHLRESTWSDGTPLTAHDFEYAFKRVIDPDAAYQQAEYAYDLMENARKYAAGEITDLDQVGVKALDDYTLFMRAEVPNVETLSILAGAAWLPMRKDVCDQLGAAYGTEAANVCCNGPFVITSWAHEDRIILEKNEKYWDADSIHLTKITSILNAVDQTAADMMLAGELDMMTTTKAEVMQQVVDAGAEMFNYTSQLQMLLTGGANSGLDKFFDNENFMKAVNLAIDREAIVNALLPGSIPATRITPPSTMGVEKPFVEEYPFEGWPAKGDVAKAKEYLDAALKELNCTVEDVPEMVVLCYESENNLRLIQAFQDMLLRNLGLKMGIEQLPIQAMFGKVFSNDYDLWWSGMGVGSVDWASPDAFLPSFDWRNSDYSGTWHDEEFARLYDLATSTYDMKTRKDALFGIEKIFCEQHPPFFLIGYSQEFVCYNPKFTAPEHAFYEDVTYVDLAK